MVSEAVLSVGLFMILSCLLSPVSSQATVCTYTFNQQCIDAVKTIAGDKSKFWFGTDYAVQCPGGSFGGAGCVNPRADVADSLMTRILEDTSANSNSIQFIVNVTYMLEAKRSYMGCGEMVDVSTDSMRYMPIDPVSEEKAKPFDVSTMPMVTWPAQNGVMYSVIYVDIGYNILHGVYINIRGGDIKLGQVVQRHHGPKNPREVVNPYAWLVFEQQGELVVEDIVNFIYNNRSQFGGISMSALIQQFRLSGPVGINIVRAYTDEYAVHYMRSRAGINYCPRYTQQRITQMVTDLGGLAFDLSNPEVVTSVDLRFKDGYMDFCCDANKLQAINKTINFNTSSEVHGSDARAKPEVVIVGQSNFGGGFGPVEYFTLLAVDPTKEFGTTTPNSVVHWMITNIMGKDVTSGDTILDYRMLNPGDSDRSFLLLLYKQKDGRSESIKDVSRFSGSNCPDSLRDRCEFNIAGFVLANNLGLTGMRKVKVMTDNYSRYVQEWSKTMDMDKACWHVRGMGKPCAITSGATTLGVTVSIILCSLFGHNWRFYY